jgi:hypothetical protein
MGETCSTYGLRGGGGGSSVCRVLVGKLQGENQLRKQQRILPVTCLNISMYVLYPLDEKLQATAWHSLSLSV